MTLGVREDTFSNLPQEIEKSHYSVITQEKMWLSQASMRIHHFRLQFTTGQRGKYSLCLLTFWFLCTMKRKWEHRDTDRFLSHIHFMYIRYIKSFILGPEVLKGKEQRRKLCWKMQDRTQQRKVFITSWRKEFWSLWYLVKEDIGRAVLIWSIAGFLN